MPLPTRPQQLGLLILLGLVSALTSSSGCSVCARPFLPFWVQPPLERARSASSWPLRHGGEVISCDSTAVYRGFDIGTDKVPVGERRGVPHHLIDVVEPTDVYTAAGYVRDAVAAIEAIYSRGRWPILVGGTGLYYRALVARAVSRARRRCGDARRLEAIAGRRGVEFLHRMLMRVDPPSAGASSLAIANA